MDSDDFALEADMLVLDGWEPFSTSTEQVGGTTIQTYLIIAYRKQFPRDVVDREVAQRLAEVAALAKSRDEATAKLRMEKAERKRKVAGAFESTVGSGRAILGADGAIQLLADGKDPERGAFEVVEKKGEQWFLSVIIDDVKHLLIVNDADNILVRGFIPYRRVKE